MFTWRVKDRARTPAQNTGLQFPLPNEETEAQKDYLPRVTMQATGRAGTGIQMSRFLATMCPLSAPPTGQDTIQSP